MHTNLKGEKAIEPQQPAGFNQQSANIEGIDFPGYPLYPADEDIYNKNHNETSVDPEDISKKKPLNEKDGLTNELNYNNDEFGNDLDIPGSELDDKMEDIGSEDEENNLYSLGEEKANDLYEHDSE